VGVALAVASSESRPLRARLRSVADSSVVLVALGPAVALEEASAEDEEPPDGLSDVPPPPAAGVAFFVGEAAGLLAGALDGLEAAAFGGGEPHPKKLMP